MAFWKKSEDPWDREPTRPSAPVTQFDEVTEEQPEDPGFLDSLKTWNESRKAEQSRKALEETPPPISCPWCGKDMKTGQLTGGRGVFWAEGFPTTQEKWIGSAQRKQIQVDTEGVFYTYRTAWFCEDCRKLVADFPEPPADTPEARTQKEYEDELRRYAAPANKREGEH